MTDLDELYQQIILDHARRPRHKRPLSEEESQATADNPTCGDEIRLRTRWSDGRVAAVEFDGHGCAISQASASLMTDLLPGKTPDEARELADRLISVLRGENTPTDPDEFGEAAALLGVRAFPLRIKCATLAWHAFKKTLPA